MRRFDPLRAAWAVLAVMAGAFALVVSVCVFVKTGDAALRAGSVMLAGFAVWFVSVELREAFK